MAKSTTATTTTCWRITVNNAPPPKRTQKRTINSHGTPLTRTKVKEKMVAWRNVKKESVEQELIMEGYNGDLKILLGVPAILLVPKATPNIASTSIWEPLVSCMALAKYISCFLSSPPFSLNLYCQLYHPYDCFIPLNVFYIASFPWTSIFCSYPCLPSTQEGGRIHQSLFIINFYFSFFYNKFYRFKKHANQKKI